MLIDYSYSTLQQFPLYQGLGNVWTFNGTAGSTALTGQWSNVLMLESVQPLIELHGQEWVRLGSDQSRYQVELP